MSSPVINDNKKKIKRGFFAVVTGRTFIIAVLLLVQFLVMLWGFERLGDYIHLGSALVTALMLLYVINSASDPTVKLTWCFVIALVPVVGIPLYFYIKLDVGHRTVQRAIGRYVVETAPYMRPRLEEDTVDPVEELAGIDPAAGGVARYLRDRAGFPAYRDCEVKYFPLGEEKFAAMLRALEEAEQFIFMEYFIVSEGRMWSTILDVLARKARAGVEVRFMYDGTCAFADIPYSYPEQLEKMGIKCKMFAPVRPLVSTHYNNRDHRKILVVDGRVAFTGGVNLADEYINEKPRFGHWKDTAIEVRGPAVRSFTLMFLQMWNSTERAGGCHYERYLPPEEPREDSEGFVIPYGDSPMDDERVGELTYLQLINTARDYVYIMSPYLILDEEAMTAITFAAKRGVDVRLILPHIPDKKYAFWLAKSHYSQLLAAGVKVYEYIPGFVHAKVVLVDGLRAVVGTINFDYRSFYHHFECAALLCAVPAIRDIRRDFDDTLQKCHRVTKEDVAHEKLHVRILGALLKVVAPLM